MENKKLGKIFCIISLILVVITIGLSIWKDAFISSSMLMISLLLFSICFYLKDKKKIIYILFTIGVLLIFGSLAYTIMRIM